MVKRFSVERWDGEALQAAAVSCAPCTDSPGLVGIDMVAQDGNVFAHGHLDVDVARQLHDDLRKAIELAAAAPAQPEAIAPDELWPSIDEAAVRRIFNQLNFVTAGEQAINALAAIQDLYCAMICVVSDDRVEAMRTARNMHDSVLMTIRKNFDWYTAQGKIPVGPVVRS